jgi:16S rRNA (cytosine967-C5)-methyltransferase
MSSTARDLAVLALCDRAGNVSAALDRLVGQTPLGAADRALAYELALGSLRRQRTLEIITHAFLHQPGKHLPRNLEAIVRAALYQLLFLTRVPAFAAVDEAVRQAIDMQHKRQSGLVNALLRTVLREMSDETFGPCSPAADVLPVSAGSYRRFSKPIFADPLSDPAGHLGQVHSLPDELVQRWLRNLGDSRQVQAVCAHSVARPPMILRVNRLRAGLDQVMTALGGQGHQAMAHSNGWNIVLVERAGVHDLEAFEQGLVQPQDATSTEVGLAVQVNPGMNVLDFCAAPGTKATHLAELMDNRGRVAAVDVSSEKIQRISDNCRRLGISIVEPMLAEDLGRLELGSFDRVLADVPCSNTGVLARRPEARWRFSVKALEQLAQDQLRLGMAAAEYVKPGGLLVYSTCSLEPEECSQVVADLTARKPQMRLEREHLTLPAGVDDAACWRDGGYLALLRRV